MRNINKGGGLPIRLLGLLVIFAVQIESSNWGRQKYDYNDYENGRSPGRYADRVKDNSDPTDRDTMVDSSYDDDEQDSRIIPDNPRSSYLRDGVGYGAQHFRAWGESRGNGPSNVEDPPPPLNVILVTENPEQKKSWDNFWKEYDKRKQTRIPTSNPLNLLDPSNLDKPFDTNDR